MLARYMLWPCVRLTYCLLKYLLISGMDKVRVAVPKWAWSGHVTQFYILDLENFATASRWCNGVVNKNRRRQLVDHTYD